MLFRSCGQIVQAKQHTEISVLVRPHGMEIVWFALWMAFGGIAIKGALCDAFVGGDKLIEALPFVVMCLLMTPLPWVLFQVGISNEMFKGRAALEWALREPRLPRLGPENCHTNNK